VLGTEEGFLDGVKLGPEEGILDGLEEGLISGTE
jgi:hypothetical protein